MSPEGFDVATKTGAEKQAARRERLRKRGLVNIQAWVRPDQAEAIRRIMADMPVDYRPPGDMSLKPDTARRSPAKVTCHHEPLQSAPEPPPAVTPPTEPKAPEAPRDSKPKLKKGEREGEWRVFVDGAEIGTVTKRPPSNRWRIHRKGSAFDALSERTYRTRADAVKALLT